MTRRAALKKIDAALITGARITVAEGEHFGRTGVYFRGRYDTEQVGVWLDGEPRSINPTWIPYKGVLPDSLIHNYELRNAMGWT